ncbi:MAG: nucleotide-binding protein [Candidatus Odinarchaeia archaeon]
MLYAFITPVNASIADYLNTANYAYMMKMRILCFTSAQGGVGKKQVIANLAALLVKLKKRVLIADFCNSFFGEILNKKSSLLKILDKNHENGDIIKEFNAVKEEYDYVMVCLNSSQIFHLINGDLFILTTPLRLSLIKTKHLVENLKNNKTEIKLIVNKFGENKRYEYSISFIEKVMNIPVLQVIPYDPMVIKSEQLGLPLTDLGKSAALLSILKTTIKITGLSFPPSVFNNINLKESVKIKG